MAWVKIATESCVPLRLRPYLPDHTAGILRICGFDNKVNLIFSKLYGQMTHLFIKGLSTLYENL